MNTVPSSHVSWSKIWVVVGALLVPGLTVGTMIIRGGQKLVDKVDVVIVKQDKADSRMDKLEEKINTVAVRVDTITHRQEINTIINNYRYQQRPQPIHVVYKTQQRGEH